VNKFLRATAITAGAGVMLMLGACSTTSAPDEVGLYYMQGPSDGDHFGECIKPGETGSPEWNNQVYYLPANMRTWTIDDMPDPANPGKFIITPGADSADVTVISAKPEKDQPSGIQVKVATKTAFQLNTFCDDKGGVAKVFWEKIGRRYYVANPQTWWKDMLEAILAPTLRTIVRDVVRGSDTSADALVANADGVQATLQKKIGEQLAVEFNRTAGGNFFCGPSFDRTKEDCPPLELLIIDVDYADPGIRAARNEKQKQLELAAAKLAEAQGIANALIEKARGEAESARQLQALYNSPGWVALQKTIENTKAIIEACKVAKECRLIIDSDGNLIMQ